MFSPLNSAWAALPTITSVTAGRNMRPWTIFSSGRSACSCGPTPRIATLTSALSSLRKTLIKRRASADAIGLPAASRLTPGASSTRRAASRPRALPVSDAEPLRITIARSSRPECSMVSIMPVDIASTEISTATTPAMPITMTIEVPTRCGKLLKFIVVTAPICLNRFMSCLPPPKRIDHAELARPPCRLQAADQRGQQHRAGTHDHDDRRHAEIAEDPAQRPGFENERGKRQADGGGEHAQHQRLDQHQGQYLAVGEAERLEHRELRRALAHGLHHRVGGEKQ